MPDREPPLPPVPEARAVSRKRTPISLVWVIPILAAVVGAWVAVTRILGQGPEITIAFKSAEGLEAGKTKIQHNGVDVGTLTTIRLSDDHNSVIVTAQMAPDTASFLVDDTKFWIVSPRISGANVTGLGTLISGAYIGMEIGQSKKALRNFVGLDVPPVVTIDAPGRFFTLKTPDLGSIDSGTPIYFRRLQVGQVVSYELDKGGGSLSLKVFVNAPYDQYVTPATRFWQASGVDVSLTANGLTVQTQSVLSILVGGIAFETAANAPLLPPAEPDSVFQLFSDRGAAFKLESRNPLQFELRFTDSVRGLAAGAPVEFRGIQVGQVLSVRAEVDAVTYQFAAPVLVTLDAQQFGVQIENLPHGTDLDAARRTMIDNLIAHGVRAQLRTGNLLTGALFVTFDFFPDAPPAKVDWSKTPVELPTTPGTLEAIEGSVVSIIKKLDRIPYEAIGADLRKLMAEVDRTLVGARGTLTKVDGLIGNADKLVEPNSVLSAELARTLEEVNRAARGLRVLTDYLERHPEALIRGKTGEAE